MSLGPQSLELWGGRYYDRIKIEHPYERVKAGSPGFSGEMRRECRTWSPSRMGWHSVQACPGPCTESPEPTVLQVCDPGLFTTGDQSFRGAWRMGGAGSIFAERMNE